MMTKEIIGNVSGKLPFANAVRYGSLIYLSGIVSKDLDTGEYIEGTIEEETRTVFKNIESLLSQAGSSLGKVLKTTVFLSDINDFNRMNEVYSAYFEQIPLAARSTVEAKLVGKFKIEIELVAYV